MRKGLETQLEFDFMKDINAEENKVIRRHVSYVPIYTLGGLGLGWLMSKFPTNLYEPIKNYMGNIF